LRGEVVLVRAFGGEPVKLRVWGVKNSVVFVTNEMEYEKLVAGKPALDPIAFPKRDIFCVPATMSADGSFDWSQLVLWSDKKGV